jgi:hypothetical protein
MRIRIRIHNNNCRSYLINLLGILGLLAGVKVVGEPVERLEAGLAIKNPPEKTH